MSAKFPPFFLPRPPLVTQSDPFVCWSAALESWLRVTHHPKKMTQGQIQQEYIFGPRGRDFTGTIGGLTLPDGFQNLVREFDLASRRFDVSDPYDRFAYQMLASHKYLFMAYPVPHGASHAVVVYGIGIMNPRRGYELAVMDPFPLSRNGDYDETGTARVRALGDELDGMSRFENPLLSYARGFYLAWQK